MTDNAWPALCGVMRGVLTSTHRRDAQMLLLAALCGLLVVLLQVPTDSSANLVAAELGILTFTGVLLLLPVIETSLSVASGRKPHWADYLTCLVWMTFLPMIVFIFASWTDANSLWARMFSAMLGMCLSVGLAHLMSVELPEIAPSRFAVLPANDPDPLRLLSRVWPGVVFFYLMVLAVTPGLNDAWVALQIILLPSIVPPVRQRLMLEDGQVNIARISGFFMFAITALWLIAAS
ncbi:MAG: hypothetical protein AAFY74_19805 [Pseudomonadota bacterium]